MSEFRCRFSGSSNCVSVIPLGEMPLANALLRNKADAKHEVRCNLEVMLCRDSGLVQLRDLIPPEELFSDYVYFSSNSQTMLESVADLAQRYIPKLDKNSLVVEIASNDGYLLKNYVAAGIPVLGIDPARNIAKVANDAGIRTVCDFFGQPLAEKLVADGFKADIIHANNVFAHVPDINSFVAGIKIMLAADGVAIIEVPYLGDLVKKREFDTIYHEHVYYFSVTALTKIFAAHRLQITDIEKLSIHGGTLRLFVNHDGFAPPSAVVAAYIKDERDARLHEEETYRALVSEIDALRQEFLATLADLKAQGASIAAYGASAKGTTLLNYFGVPQEMIDFIVDKSPAKQGLYTPGTHIEILSPEALLTRKPDYTVLLAWNFADEILRQQQAYRDQGGKFIIPIPHVMIV